MTIATEASPEAESAPNDASTHANNASPPINEGDIRQFFTALSNAAVAAFKGADDPGLINLVRVNAVSESLEVIGRYRPDDIEGMVAAAIGTAESGQNVYVDGRTVSGFLPRHARGKFEDTRGVFAIVADRDKDHEAFEAFSLEPSIQVQTSEQNLQDWYFFDRAVLPVEARAIGKAFGKSINSDDDSGVVTQPYRVAGTPNFVNKTKRERGRFDSETRLLKASGPIYPKEAIVAELERKGFSPSKYERSASSSNAGGRKPCAEDAAVLFKRSFWPAALEQEFAGEQECEDRSAAFHGVIGRAKREGYDLSEIITMFEAFPDSIYNQKYRGRLEQEVCRSWESILKDEEAARQTTGDAAGGADKTTDETDDEWGSSGAGDEKASPDPFEGVYFMGDDLPKEPPALVKDLLPKRGLVFIGGPSGAGKSFVAVDLAVNLAAGRSFFGHEIPERGATIYIAAEGSVTIPPRLLAARIGLGLEDGHYPVAVVSDVGDLSSPSDLEAANKRVKSIAQVLLERFGIPARLVIIDTLAAAFSYKDENSSGEMGRVLKRLVSIGDSINALTLAVHHFGKNADGGLRGTSAIRARADAVLAVTADRVESTGVCSNRQLVLTKARSGPEGLAHGFDLQEEEIGVDGFDTITAARIVPQESRKQSAQGRRLSNGCEHLKRALEQALLANGKMQRFWADQPEVKTARDDEVRQIFYSGWSVDTDTQEKRTAARNKAYNRALKDAQRISGSLVNPTSLTTTALSTS